MAPETPLEDFERKLKKGYFSSLREKEDAINQRLNEDAKRKYYVDLLEDIRQQRDSHKKPMRVDYKQ